MTDFVHELGKVRTCNPVEAFTCCTYPAMSKADAAWSSADLAKAVCDELVAQGLLKEKPAFIR